MKTVRVSSVKSDSTKKYQVRFNRRFLKLVVVVLVLVTVAAAYRAFFLPLVRVELNSRLVMLGDLNSDKKWSQEDLPLLRNYFSSPFSFQAEMAFLIDINRDGLVDNQDVQVLEYLYDSGDPYAAKAKAAQDGITLPMPREMFAYIPESEYLVRPVFTSRHPLLKSGILSFLQPMLISRGDSSYLNQLMREISNEALRFSMIYERRKDKLNAVEKAFVAEELQLIRQLNEKGDYFGLLLELILMSEAGETLSTNGISPFVLKVRSFGLALREYLVSPNYVAFQDGKRDHLTVFSDIEQIYQQSIGQPIKIAELPPSRDLTKLENYVDRAVWQVYKSKAKESDFRSLISFAQNDRRYLRAVSRTTPRHNDIAVKNHNLPMMLLFREALRINGGDKKSAVGLLDEAIRIPYAWIKSIPRKLLPSSVALESFLLPGNMEDGSDKSRHWNVFGGIALHKSPEESLDLALRREIKDAKEGNYSSELMTEFIRDTIANCFGIYHVVSIDSTIRPLDDE